MDTVYYPYIGSGQMYGREYGAAAGMLPMGNVSKAELQVKEDKKNLKDYTKPGGGNYATNSRIDTITLKMTMHDPNKTNLARATYGTESIVTGAPVVDEPAMLYKGAITKTRHPAPSAVTLTNPAGTTTYAPGVDYEVRPGGIFVLESGAIVNGAALVDYTFETYYKVEALTGSAKTLEIFFEGLNGANNGKPMFVEVYKVKLSPAQVWSLISDDFAELEIEAEVLKDTTKTGAGMSQYFHAQLAQGSI